MRMNLNLCLILLLSWTCWTNGSSPRRQSVSFSMIFSDGTYLLVDVNHKKPACEEDEPCLHSTEKKGHSITPSIQIFSPVGLAEDPVLPPLLVCLLNGLVSPFQEVMWWIDDVQKKSAEGPWIASEGGYSAILVWDVPAAAWRPYSSYWCGTVQDGRMYRQKLCLKI